MSFGFHSGNFISQLAPLTKRVGRLAFSGAAPRALYHYTKPKSADQIKASREIWAVCLTEQEDFTELTHGIALVESAVMEILDRESNLFVKRVMSKVPDFIRTRKQMIFITCFCGIEASEFHLKEYGSTCLKFELPLNGASNFECIGSQADSWYAPVIYGKDDQVRAIEMFLNEVIKLLVTSSNGDPAEDTGGWMAAGPIRDIGQCLTTLISCFKRDKYRREKEWRLIFMPTLALSSSAPKMVDDAFSRCVVNLPKRHVRLRRTIPFRLEDLEDGCTWSPSHEERLLPFIEVIPASPISQYRAYFEKIRSWF